MVRNCPQFLLVGQLDILRPKAVLMFGSPAHRTLKALDLDIVWETRWVETRCFSRCRARLSGEHITFLALHHPAYNAGWARSWRALVGSLKDSPLELGSET